MTDALCSSADETHDAMMNIYMNRFGLQVETITTESPERYRHDYSKKELESWANRIRASGARGAWVYSDAYAPKNATVLPRMLGSPFTRPRKKPDLGVLACMANVFRCLGGRFMTSKFLWGCAV